MAELTDKGNINQTTFGSLKKGLILYHEDAGNKHYIKIGDLEKVKTGKHGAAKVMISGKNLKTGKGFSCTSPGGLTCATIEFTKRPFILEDVLDDCFYMRPNDSSQIGGDSYYYDKVDPKEVENLIGLFESNNRSMLSLTVISGPDYVSFENIRPFGDEATEGINKR